MDLQVVLEQRAKVEEFQRKHRIGLLTLLFTDLVGSTKLKQELGEVHAVPLLQWHREIVRETISRFQEAEEIETAGDSFFIVFAKPSDAVKFALLLQAKLRASVQTTPQPLFDRIGIHVGEVFIEEHEGGGKARDLYGIQVDTCARVTSLAEADQILITRFAFDSARQVLKGQEVGGLNQLNGLQWLNHGPYLLKGVEEPLEICEVGEVGVAALKPPPDSDKVRRYVSPDAEPVLGWRPALEQKVPGTQWVLEEKVGEGGFGEVWLGQHSTTKEHRVFKFCFRADRVRALKREVTLFRLLKERVGEHPNVVRLLEVFFEEPPFYLEMEYVAGRDLKTWCEARRRDGMLPSQTSGTADRNPSKNEGGWVDHIPLETRLEIVAQIADALQAAHDAGVIHRDVKPSNILIADYGLQSADSPIPQSAIRIPKSPASQPSTINSQPTAKLTDFGIGQVVSEDCLSGITRAGFTQTIMSGSSSSHTGTQLYMAPELLAGKPASIRSDIYSLGVVLYQMLVGDFTRPVTTDWWKEISDPLLRDDLEHCFAGNPNDRFAGSGQLATQLRALPHRRAELERQQAEKVVLERAAYQRGMMRTAGIAVVIVGVVAALAVVALNQSRRAKAEAVKSTQVAAFLKDMLKSVGPSIARGRDTALLREILDNTISRIEKELNAQPEVEADLRVTLSRTYQDLGDYSAAAAVVRRALDLRRKHLGARHDSVGEALNQLAKEVSLQGDWPEAERLQREALAIREKSLGRDHLVVADMLNDLGIMLVNSGKLPEARDAYWDALRIKEKLLSFPNEKLADAHLNVSLLLLDLGDFVRGEGEAREALTAYRKLFGENHPKVGMALHNQAKNLRELARLDEAERAIRDAIEVYGRVYQGGHAYHAEALDDLGLILEKKGNAKGTDAAFRDSLIMVTRLLGEDHPQTLLTMRHAALAVAHVSTRVREAEEMIQRATALGRQKFAKQPAALANCLQDLCAFFVMTDRPKDAEPLLLEAYRLLANANPSSKQLRKVCRELELLYGTLHQPEEARKWTAKLAELGKD